jgi:hypothetical protein
MSRYWKVLDAEGRACHGGTFRYDLPKAGKPGKWTPRIKNLEACQRGYHVCRDADLIHWCNGATIYACEVRGVVTGQSDKVVVESIRLIAPTPWDAVTARLFAVECAADVLHLNADPRVADCLEAAYRFAFGDATDAERAAAWDAAGDAAGDAAVAARDAAVAAWDAARDAAARNAAGAAAVAAWAAAWAAWAAARDSARAAARDAARARQTARLLWWLGASKDYPEVVHG